MDQGQEASPIRLCPGASMPSTALHVRPLPSTTTTGSSHPPTTPSSPVSGAPIGRAAVPCPTLRRRLSANASHGTNRYEIYAVLKPILKQHTPKPSTMYAITRRHGVNRLTYVRFSSPSARSSRPGQGSWATSDSHHLSRDLLIDSKLRSVPGIPH